jgi:transposase
MSKLYVGIDLHGNNNFIGILDGQGRKTFNTKLNNIPGVVLDVLRPYKKSIKGIAVESTFNWYWLVDALMDDGYPVHLANPAAIQQYSGLKHSDDKHDAFWLAEMLRLGILPEGYIYPKEERPVRDLLRKRGHLVRLRTSLVLSLENIICRNVGRKVIVNDIKRLKEDRITPLLEANEDLSLAGRVSKEMIDNFTRQILKIENWVEKRIALKEGYHYLLTLPGVGKILSLTIMLETGPISRFRAVGDYVSYCRKVPSQWTSNGKKKGSGNSKNGNKYLAWAYSEASDFARRKSSEAGAYYQKKKQKTNAAVAHNALAHKLARAAYYVMRDEVPFMPKKLFG